jgi:glucokinase
MHDDLQFVGLDVGGTTMKAGVVDGQGRPYSNISVPTEAQRGQDWGLEQMCVAIRQAVSAANLALADIAAIGVATPGLMDIPGGLIVDPPNLKPWKNVPVRQHVADTFKLPTAFQNDANAAAMGEYWAGAGQEVNSMVLFTLGTGVGGGIVIGDQVLEGKHSHGGELGHMKVEPRNGRLCGCGKRGCLEQYGSASAVTARLRELLATRPEPSALRTLETFSAREVFAAANAGDVLATQIVDETAFYLALGAANVIAVKAGEGFLERIRHHLAIVGLPIPVSRVIVRAARLGNDAGFIGAAGCARQLLRTLHK